MAEIKIERRQHSLLPWIVGLILLALVILAAAAHHRTVIPVHRPGAAAVDNQWDNIPPKLRQYA